ncbi:MAG: GTP cyclohydrolase I [Burkholderiaceae bacterium]
MSDLPSSDLPSPPAAEAVSARIRKRLQAADQPFFANDNIADFIADADELDALEAEVAQTMEALLQSLVIDTVNDHNTQGTAKRVARMFLDEVFRGRYHPQPVITEFPNAKHLNELMIVGPVDVRSACSHHFVPIIGKLWIGVLGSETANLIGLSKFSRVADWVMSRPQIQEEAIVQLADLLEKAMRPDGLAIVLKANHLCTQWRGVKDGSHMTNSVMRGTFLTNAQSRMEFLALIEM